jgi:hypothetical protein
MSDLASSPAAGIHEGRWGSQLLITESPGPEIKRGRSA